MIHIQVAEALFNDGQDLSVAQSEPFDTSLLEQAAAATLQHARRADSPGEPVDLTVMLADDTQLHELNRHFLGIDAPTDVLSFPADETDPDSEALYLGDVIISYPRAQAQAATGGHPVTAELQLLVVHGVLHLLGYDHAEEDEKAEMWAMQAEILHELGSEISGPP